MCKKVTIIDIARMAGVSTATVSRIINNTGNVSERKKQKVLDLIAQYDYQPNQIAKALQASRSNMVGVIVPHINSSFYAQLFYETERCAQKSGFTLMLCNSESRPELESQILKDFLAADVRAIIFMGGRLDNLNCDSAYIQEIEDVSKRIPVISCVDYPGLHCVQVFQDVHSSTLDLLNHLSGRGYKDIALLGGSTYVRTTRNRREEILNYAEDFNISVRRDVIDSDYSVAGGYVAMRQLLDKPNHPQAVVCINDMVAAGALSAIQNCHLKTPQDIAVTGYDNLEISRYIYHGITTIACDYIAYSEAIVNAIKQIDDLDNGSRIAVQTSLIIGGTTRL